MALERHLLYLKVQIFQNKKGFKYKRPLTHLRLFAAPLFSLSALRLPNRALYITVHHFSGQNTESLQENILTANKQTKNPTITLMHYW